MIGRKRLLVGVVMVVAVQFSAAAAVHAQFWEKLTNPQVTLPINHPPGLGILINKVAFGQPTGSGATEFADELTARFVAKNVEVIERERLQAMLREHNFSMSGYVDKASAAEIGKIVGPAVMIFVDFSRNQTEKKALHNDWKTSKGEAHRTYISRTTVYLKGSIRSVDLATGRIFAAKILEASPVRENKIDDRGQPEYPDEHEIFDMGMRMLVGQAERLFLPWTSSTTLYYFDDSDCGMKAAFGRMKAVDVQGALDQSIASVEACKVLPKPNPKALAHANHNAGMSYFALGDYGKALSYLGEAEKIRPASIHEDAISMVRTAEAEQFAMQRVEERASLSAATDAQRTATNEASAVAAMVTNKDVLAMTQAKLPTAVILAKIKNSPCRFDTGADALIEMKKAGVADDVIVAMMECKKTN